MIRAFNSTHFVSRISPTRQVEVGLDVGTSTYFNFGRRFIFKIYGKPSYGWSARDFGVGLFVDLFLFTLDFTFDVLHDEKVPHDEYL